MFIRGLLAASATLAVVKGIDVTPTPTPTSTSTEEPCAVVSSLLEASQTAIPAETAYSCLKSVPVDVEGDKKLIDELKVAWQWHSDVTWLKSPPKDWENGPLDLMAALDDIKDHLSDFNSEYEVQLAIQKLTARTGDFHLNWVPDILQVFIFRRQFGVVALSEDGTSIPKLYVVADAKAVDAGLLEKDAISNIDTINGEPAFTYLEELALWEQYRDSDGRLNSLLSKGDTLTLGGFIIQSRFDGYITEIKFANGTKRSYENFATTSQDWGQVHDGKSFYENFCDGSISGLHGEETDWTPRLHDKRAINPEIFPTAVVAAKSGAVAGYFLTGSGYDDVAVLKIMTFDPQNDEYGLEFQATISEFLKTCIEEKKNNLILDLRENGGGQVQLMLDTFKQLFPHRNVWQGHRYRSHPQYDLIGDAVSEIYTNETMHEYYEATWNGSINTHYRHWAYSHFLTAQGENFESWEEVKGPELFNGDNYTAAMRYNYSNADDVSIRYGTFQFTDPSGLDTAFNHTNIVMFTDALCGSACAAIHEELKNNAGVRSVTVGGRALEGPIQAVSGTKGGEVVPLSQAIIQAEHMRNISHVFGLKSIPEGNTVLDSIIDTPNLQRRAGDKRSRFQTQLEMRKGDKTGTPLQYIYEAADCRIFYRYDTFSDPNAAWKQVWDAFQDDSHCVKNSTKHPSSISGGFTPYGPWVLRDEDLAVPGSNATAPGITIAVNTKPADEFKGAASTVHGADGIYMAAFMAVVIGLVQL